MMQPDNRIVVTGIGTVSAYGTDSEALWSALRDGSPAPVEAELEEQLPVVRVKGYSAIELLGKKGLQFMHPCSQYLLGASVLALRDAGLEQESVSPDRLGIVVGSNYAGFRMSEEYDKITLTEGPRYVSPMEAPNTLANAPASYLAIRIQSRAFNTTVSTGICAGLDALGYAMTMLRKGSADIAVASGTEEWNDQIRWHYENARLFPQADRPGGGLLPGEGSASAVLERHDDAVKRGAAISAEIRAWHASFSPRSDRESRALSMARTVKRAVDASGIGFDEIGWICSGVNGIDRLDQAEADALESLFGEFGTPIRSVKGTIGEAYGASGLFQLFAAVRSLQEGCIPAAAGGEPQPWSGSGRAVLITAQDRFGGMSAVVVKAAEI